MLKTTQPAQESSPKKAASSDSSIYYEVTEGSGGYGIAIKTRENGESLFSLEDITASSRDIEGFVALCNRLQLSRIHFLDAVDDFIG